jgi:hypothetical protein
LRKWRESGGVLNNHPKLKQYTPGLPAIRIMKLPKTNERFWRNGVVYFVSGKEDAVDFLEN